MDQKYTVVVWSDYPRSYSSVKVSSIKYDKNVYKSEQDLVGQLFNITFEGEDLVGKVLQAGSRAKMCQSAANLASDAAEDSFVEAESSQKRLRKRNSVPTLYSGKKTRAVVFDDSPTNVNETDTAPQDALLDNSNDIASKIIFPDEPLCDANINLINSLKAQILEKHSLVEDLRSKLRGKDRKISKLQQKLSHLWANNRKNQLKFEMGLQQAPNWLMT